MATDQNIAAAENAVPGKDLRTPKEVLRQFDRLRIVKGQLVKAGALSADATPQQILDELRKQIPADLF